MRPLTLPASKNPPFSDLPAHPDPRLNPPFSRRACSARLTARPGSVLILVVALLVLMALLGTAYISTTRIDRQTSAQHTKNVQIDMLVQGVVNQVSQAIQGDLYDASGNYRPPDTTSSYGSNYDDYDSFGFTTPYDVRGLNGAPAIAGAQGGVAEDSFLADRYPAPMDPDVIASAANPPMWRNLSYPVQKDSQVSVGQFWRFDSPLTDPTGANPPKTMPPVNNTPFSLQLPFSPSYAGNTGSAVVPSNFTAKPWFRPTVAQYTPASGGSVETLPALQAYAWNQSTPPRLQAGPIFIAGDADGDGIADCGLTKLPIGTIDGVTYYVGVRIVDNNSAINVNTALSNIEFTGAGTGTPSLTAPSQYFGRYYTPASEGLAELLRTTQLAPGNAFTAKGNEIQALSEYWLQNPGVLTPPSGVQQGTGTAYYDGGGAINAFQYQSIQDALSETLGDRIGNSGTLGAAGPLRAQGFSATDSMALAYHNGLLNPEASGSTLDSVFDGAGGATDSIYRGAPNYLKRWSSYAPQSDTDIVNKWFANNFAYLSETAANQANWMSRRPMLVASNPVSIQAPIWRPTGAATTSLPQFALDDGMLDYRTNAPPNVQQAPTKVSINQAPFPDLWRAFWEVMAEKMTVPTGFVNAGQNYRVSPVDLRMLYRANDNPALVRANLSNANSYDLDPPTFNDPYLGTTFNDYLEGSNTSSGNTPTDTGSYNPTAAISVPSTPTDYHPARMFRSPIRAVPDPAIVGGFNSATPRLDAHQTMMLRSAIAAVNAQDLRDSDDDVTAQRIVLQPSIGTSTNPNGAHVPADVIVYGTERQPYITEVVVDTDIEYTGTPAGSYPRNPYGYVGIELYNPYDQDILLKNWKLVAVDRRSFAATAGNPPPYLASSTTHGGVNMPKYNIPLDSSALIADFDPAVDVDLKPDVLVGGTANLGRLTANTPLVVPAHGYLLLENYYDPTYGAAAPPDGAAGHRPVYMGANLGTGVGASVGPTNNGIDRSTGPAGTIIAPNARAGLGAGGADLPRLNVACVPGLSGMLDDNWNTPEWPMGVGMARRSVLNRELILLRPRRADGQYSSGFYPPVATPAGTYGIISYDETPNPIPGSGEVSYSHLRDLIPVDSFDFTGLRLPVPNAGTPIPEPLGRSTMVPDPNNPTTQIPDPFPHQAAAWHYVRQNADFPGALRGDWKFVYPGRYNAEFSFISSTKIPPDPTPGDPRPRQQGTQHTGWNDGEPSPWEGGAVMTPRRPSPVGFTMGTDQTSGQPASNENTGASFPTSFKIPLACGNYSLETVSTLSMTLTRNTIGENPLSIATAAQNRYPFGGFARDGDILATPYIGAYTIRYQGLNGSSFSVGEMNSVSMDSVFAEDTDIHDDPELTDDQPPANGLPEREQLGRFCPIKALTDGSAPQVQDYNPSYPTPNFTNYTTPNCITVNDFGFDPSYVPANGASQQRGADWEPYWRYHWAMDLFDYLTVRVPSDDYLPNYPMQKDWVQGRSYYKGDLISFYNNNTMSHEIYVCRSPNPPASATSGITPVGDGNFIPAFQCPAVKNTSDIDAAFRTDLSQQYPMTLPNLQSAYVNQHREDNVPVEGLVNVNTAGWRVLATLPLIVNPQSGLPDDVGVSTVYGGAYPGWTFRQLNQELAKAIVYYRDVDANPAPNVVQPHGPFRSIFELNQVVDLRTSGAFVAAFGNNVAAGLNYPGNELRGFQNGFGLMPLANVLGGAEPGDSLGDFSPADYGSTAQASQNVDGVRGDYEERNLQLTRISNMITTRSDSFTCYILVQGWRNAETPNAQLVVQRRVGYLMDRSRVTPLTPDAMSVEPFPNN